MPSFALADGGYLWRPLRLTSPAQSGWDVVALQTGLQRVGKKLPGWGADGYFGKETKAAVLRFQRDGGLKIVDGIAGGATQRAIATILAEEVRSKYELPHGIPYGHIEKESSFILGNHTAPYTDGSRDCGVVQRNTNYTPMEHGFNTGASIMALGTRVREYRNKYQGWGVAGRRAWELACGSWNAPAWCDRLAKGEALPPDYAARIESYIDAVTAYADL